MALSCCIIDEDLEAADELAAVLEKDRRAGPIRIVSAVPGAMEIMQRFSVQVLFIRATLWDDYRKVSPLLPAAPDKVVFLSGRREHCTAHLPYEVEFHLKAPYSESKTRRILERMAAPGFRAAGLEFFFLRVDCRLHAIRDENLQWIRRNGPNVIVKTADRQYEVASSLEKMQERLPVRLERVARGLLVAKGWIGGE